MAVKTYSKADLDNYLSEIGGTNQNKNLESFVRRTLRRISFFDMVYEMKSNFGRCLFDKNYKPRYLFHGTTKDRLVKILQEGLSPSKSFLGPIYFAATFDDAKSWAYSKSIRGKSKPMVIYVDQTLLPELTFERRDESTFRCNEQIPPESINRVRMVLKYLLTH
ncbi:MAG: hypothetical protein WC584_03285 [Candidatus Pacearchaeota archaeon]